tara:strand:+ start:187 stop:543 length:357 start_codon:yes stop_codon:yes gene_type:complete
MEQLLPILIGTSIGFGFFYENLKLQKQIKEVEVERDQIKNQIDRYFRQMKRAIGETKKHMAYRYESELWRVDSQELLEELLKRVDDDGEPIFTAACRNEGFKKRVVFLTTRKKIYLGS